MIKIVPIIIGVVGSYLVAAVFGKVDFTQVAEAAWIGNPVKWDHTVFYIFGQGVDSGLLITAVITIIPIALATMVEHIGDFLNRRQKLYQGPGAAPHAFRRRACNDACLPVRRAGKYDLR